MNKYSQNVLKARDLLGSFDAVGKVCGGLSGKAIMKWRDKGRPPRTEYTGETNYARLIEEATNGMVKESDLRPDIYCVQSCDFHSPSALVSQKSFQ